jgi:hypothetical protein
MECNSETNTQKAYKTKIILTRRLSMNRDLEIKPIGFFLAIIIKTKHIYTLKNEKIKLQKKTQNSIYITNCCLFCVLD